MKYIKNKQQFLFIDFQGTRSEMHQHGELSRTTHDILLLSTVKNLKEQSNQKDLEIRHLKETNANTNETLNKLKRNFEDLNEKFERLKKRVEINEEETKQLLNEIIENKTEKSQQLIKDVENLNKFANRASLVHHALSEKWLRRNYHYDETIFQENYDKNEDVKVWNEMVDEINEDENECSYLKTLKSSVNRYKQTIYSTTYEERLKNFYYTVPLGEFRNGFIRIGCSSLTKSICVKFFNKFDDFKNEIGKNERGRTLKVQNDFHVCSYYVGYCLHVLFFFICDVQKAYLLHDSNEHEKLPLQNEKEVLINDINRYRKRSSIVLYITL